LRRPNERSTTLPLTRRSSEAGANGSDTNPAHRLPWAVKAYTGSAHSAVSGQTCPLIHSVSCSSVRLVTRQEATLIGAVQFVALPLTFLSSGLMASNLLPGWIQDVARFNPVN
jgi:hypothetical protein